MEQDRHLALYFGVSGSGAVMHTVNPRLFPEQIAYIINHAEDRVLFFDITFAPLVSQLAPELDTVEAYVAMTDREHMPDVPGIPGGRPLCWDELIGSQSAHTTGPGSTSAARRLCATPPGPQAARKGFSTLTVRRCCTPCCGASIYRLMRDENVTVMQGVPTVWMMLFAYLDEHPEIDAHEVGLQWAGAGGSALSRSLLTRMEGDFGAEGGQGWGMTETSPICVVGRLLPKHAQLPPEEQAKVKLKQGRGVCGVQLKIVDDDGTRLPWDGKAFGEVWVRGPWIASGYFKGEGGDKLDAEGYFPTGDIATIDPDGYLQLVDRAEDVIKSGGEWVSSIDLENAAMGHPAVAEAAVIGVSHPKWQERPLLLVVTHEGHTTCRDDLLEHLAGHVAKWWLPDDVVFVDELPHTATGKVLKIKLREQYRGHTLPQAAT